MEKQFKKTIYKLSPFRSLFWYLIPFFVKNLLPFIALPIVTSFLSVEDFGLYALSIVYGTLISGIANFGLFTVFERTFFEIDLARRNDLLFTNICFVSLVMALFSYLTWYFDIFISEEIFSNSMLSSILLFSLLLCGFKNLNQYFFYFLKNEERPKKYSLLTVSETILSISLGIIFLVIYDGGLEGYLLGQLIGVICIFLINLISLIYNKKPSIRQGLMIHQLRISLPLTPRIFFGIINGQFDRYMLGLMNTIAGVGLYDIGQKFANTSYSFMTTLQNIFAPQVYKRLFSKDEKYRKSIGAYLTPFFYLTILFSLALGLFCEELLFLSTPEEYHDSALYITILVFQISFYFFGKQPQLIFAKKTALISTLSFFSILINIGLNVPFIYFYGVQGAVWATFISGVLSSFLSFYFAQKYCYINYEKKLFYILFYFSLACIIQIYLSYIDGYYISRFIFKTILLTGYFLIGVKYQYLKIIKNIVFAYYKRLNT